MIKNIILHWFWKLKFALAKQNKPPKNIVEKEGKKYDIVHSSKKYGLGMRQVNDLKNLNYDFSSRFLQIVKDSKNCLDIACGGGTVMDYVSEVGGLKPTGIDISKKAIEKVNDDFDTFIGSCHQLPFKDNQFDLVYFLDGMEHIPAQIEIQSLREAFRVSNKYVCHSIAMGSSKRGGVELHVNIKSADKWKNLLDPIAVEFGFKEDLFYVRNNNVYAVYINNN